MVSLMQENYKQQVATDDSLISVVIPVYNAQSWIVETIESVLAQTYPHNLLELIIVDDGSTDSSVDLAETRLQGERVLWQVKRIENGGPSRARNIGWRVGNGQWVQFLDADDVLAPTKIMKQMNIASSCSMEYAVLYSPWQRLLNKSGEWVNESIKRSPQVAGDPVLELLKSENFLQLGSIIIRRDWLDRVGGFDERYHLIEDVHLLLRIAMMNGQFYKVDSPSPLFYYRQVADSLSQRNTSAFVEGCMRNAQLAEDYWRDHEMMTKERQETVTVVYLQAARYYADRDKARFEQLVQKLEAIQPNYVPPGPRHLRQLSRLIGYRKAEQVAIRWRNFKKTIKTSQQQ